MALVSVLDSLGESRLLEVFKQLLEKILSDGFVSASKATRMLAAHQGTEHASRIIHELYGGADLKQSTLLKLFCRLFPDDLKPQQLALLNRKLAALKEDGENKVLLRFPSLGIEIGRAHV